MRVRSAIISGISTFAFLTGAGAPAFGQDAAGVAEASGTTIISGVVTDQSTGRPLPGALVTVVETGQQVRTDTDGSYRIVGLPVGSYTIETSFIGLENASNTVTVTTGSSTVADVQLESLAGIVVTGSRGAQALALNDQRSRDNSATVASSDLTGKFPDNTAAEAMRRLPGVSFQRQEGSGEGQFVSIRGLDSGLNNVKINGLTSAEANAGNRRVPIDAFQSDSISKIVVNKSLLPNHEGVGLGGAVELSTSTPFELGKPLYQFAIEGNHNDFREKTGYRVSGTVSQIFGSDRQFGLLLSAAYRKRYTTSYQFQVDTTPRPVELPALVARNGAFFVPGPTAGTPFFPNSDGALPSAFEFDLETPGRSRLRTLRTQRFDIDRDNLSLTAAFDVRPSHSTTLSVIGSFNQTEFDRSESRTEYRMGSRYCNRINCSTASSAAFISPYDANGDGVAAVSEGGLFNWVPSNPEIRTRGAIQSFKSTNNTLVLKGETLAEKWKFHYQIGYAEAQTRDATNEAEFAAQQLQNATTPIINIVSPTGARFFNINYAANPQAPYIDNLTPAGQLALSTPSFFRFLSADSEFTDTQDRRYSARLDTTYEVGSWLESITAGVKFEQSKRTQNFQEFVDVTNPSATTTFVNPDGTISTTARPVFTLADANLLNGSFSFGQLGIPQYANYSILRFDPARVAAFVDNARNSSVAARTAGIGGLGGNITDEAIQEDIFAGYVMGKAVWNDWSLIGGVRVEHGRIKTNVDQSISIIANDGSRLQTTIDGLAVNDSYTELLPRFQLNYRPSNDLVFRGAFYTAIARPEYQFLSAAQSISRPTVNDNFNVSLGNPGLKNAYAYNFDVGAEWYQGSVGFVGLNLFYKRINKFIFDSEDGIFDGGLAALQASLDAQNIDVDLASLGATDNNISVSQPQNGRTAEVYGLELSVIRQFDKLPGFLSGFGIYGNLTLQKTKAELVLERDALSRELIIGNVPFFNAPNYIGTMALTYNKYGFDANLSYSVQGKSNVTVVALGDYERYDRAYDSLDFTINYTIPDPSGRELTLFVGASDILDNGDKPINHETYGASGLLLQDIEFDGRSVRFGARVKF